METLTSTATKTVSNTKLYIAVMLMFGAGAVALATVPSANFRSSAKFPVRSAKTYVKVIPLVDVEADKIILESGDTSSGVSGWLYTGFFRNIGNVDSGSFVVSIYNNDNSTGDLKLLETKTVSNLKPGEGQTIVAESTSNQSYDFDTVFLRIDEANKLKETNEDNNVYWLASNAFLFPDYYDLGVRNFRISKISSSVGQYSFDIVNYSLVDLVNINIDVEVERLDANLNSVGTLMSQNLKNLKAGRQVTFTGPIAFGGSTGKFRISIDEFHKLDDLKWSNNILVIK